MLTETHGLCYTHTHATRWPQWGSNEANERKLCSMLTWTHGLHARTHARTHPPTHPHARTHARTCNSLVTKRKQCSASQAVSSPVAGVPAPHLTVHCTDSNDPGGPSWGPPTSVLIAVACTGNHISPCHMYRQLHQLL